MVASTVESAPAALAPRRKTAPAWPRVVPGVAAAWLVFVVVQLACSDRWWLWAPVDMMPPIAYAAVPLLFLLMLALPALRGVRRAVAIIAVGAGLLGASLCGVDPGALWRSSSASAGAVSVVSWNTQYWDQTDDPTRFYSYLRAMDADVYLLQEYLNADQRGSELHLRQADDSATLVAEFPGYRTVISGELVVLSRLPVVSVASLDAAVPPAQPDFPELWTRNVLRVDVRAAGRTLSFYDVHLPVQVNLSESPLSGAFYTFLRQAQDRRAATMAVLDRDLDANPGATLVAGDFNSTPSMGAVQQLSRRLAVATPGPGSPYPVSWHGPGPRLFRLDWLFTGGGVRVDRYHFQQPSGMSDHDAQRVWVSLSR